MLIVGNQKNYMTTSDVEKYLRGINDIQDVIICPSNIYIPYYLKRRFAVGIQNIVTTNKTITGEITTKQAKSMGIQYAIIGHSERRINYPENISEKIIDALNYKLKVILCIGETIEEYNKKTTKEKLKEQISELINVNLLDNVIIAYEPIWAIGTGLTPTNTEIEETIYYIKKLVRELYGKDIKVLYGGSVNKDNIAVLKKVPNVDGFLIGKASTDIYEFKKIIEVVNS